MVWRVAEEVRRMQTVSPTPRDQRMKPDLRTSLIGCGFLLAAFLVLVGLSRPWVDGFLGLELHGEVDGVVYGMLFGHYEQSELWKTAIAPGWAILDAVVFSVLGVLAFVPRLAGGRWTWVLLTVGLATAICSVFSVGWMCSEPVGVLGSGLRWWLLGSLVGGTSAIAWIARERSSDQDAQGTQRTDIPSLTPLIVLLAYGALALYIDSTFSDTYADAWFWVLMYLVGVSSALALAVSALLCKPRTGRGVAVAVVTLVLAAPSILGVVTFIAAELF
jgi:hypothetical protein